MSKRFGESIDKLIDYFDKSLSGSISIAKFTTIIRAPIGIATARFSLAFFNVYRHSKKLLKAKQKKKKS